jgi:hypothetical protein
MLSTNTDERLNQQRQPQPMRYFMLLMAVVYMGLGTFLILAPQGMFNLPRSTRQIVGGLFVFYGLIRFVRTIRQHFRQRHDSVSR